MRVTVVIVNWNSKDLLARCLTYLSRQTLQPDCIMVVDNNSSDGSVNTAVDFENVIVHRLASNLGFAGGNNYAFNRIETEFVALLNPDAFPEPDWLENLLASAERYPDVAAFGSRQMVYGRVGVVDGVGDVYHLSGLVWRQGYGQKLDEKKMMSGDIFSPCAGAALYRTKAVKEVGGFDDDFFCYVEDVDLGFRLRLAGYKAMYVSNAVVHHVGSATTGGQHSDFAVYHGHRNLVWVYIKNMPGCLFWFCLPLHFFMNIVVVSKFVLAGQGGVILKAKRDAIAGLLKMWPKRRMIQKQRQISVADVWRVVDKRIWWVKS